MNDPLVIVIDPERPIRRGVRSILEGEKFRVIEAETAALGLTEIRLHPPSLVILDIHLPDRDGIELIRDLRHISVMPILVLSARAEERDKVAALYAGADDYMVKPFGLAEFVARVHTALRHHPTEEIRAPTFTLGDLFVDLSLRRVWKNKQEVHLTRLEYRLLVILIRYAGQVMSHRQLLIKLWGQKHDKDDQYLRIYIWQLRRKLENDPAHPDYFLTEIGVGYRLATPYEL